MPQLAQPGHCLGPAEDLFDALADSLRDCVAGMAGGAAVDRRAPATLVLRQMRGDRLLTQLHDEVGAVVALVGAQRHRPRPAGMRLDQRQRGQPLGMSGGACRPAPTTSPLRFSISAWPMNTSRASLPSPLR